MENEVTSDHVDVYSMFIHYLVEKIVMSPSLWCKSVQDAE
jgi:hypothetical protein